MRTTGLSSHTAVLREHEQAQIIAEIGNAYPELHRVVAGDAPELVHTTDSEILTTDDEAQKQKTSPNEVQAAGIYGGPAAGWIVAGIGIAVVVAAWRN